MKQFKLFAAGLMVAACAVAVTSCSKDDDSGNPQSRGKRLTKIESRSNNMPDYTDINEIEYSTDGKITKWTDAVTWNNGQSRESSVYQITYEGKTVKMIPVNDNPDGERVYTLNDRGLATSLYLSSRKASYQYSGDNLIYALGEYHSDKEGYTITWSGGNITKIAWTRTLYNDNQTHGSYTITYMDKPNKSGCWDGLWDNYTGDFFANGISYPSFAAYAGLLGKAPKNLIQSIKYESSNSSGTANFDYEFDEDGYVKKTTILGVGTLLPATYTYTYAE